MGMILFDEDDGELVWFLVVVVVCRIKVLLGGGLNGFGVFLFLKRYKRGVGVSFLV